MSSMIAAIDVSRNGGMVVAVVAAEEHVIKSILVAKCSWLKHFRKVPSREKRSYIRKFARRFQGLLGYMSYAGVFFTIDEALSELKRLKPMLVVANGKVADGLRDLNVINEGKVVSKHLKTLMLLADNLANYFRILLKERPQKLQEEAERLTKTK